MTRKCSICGRDEAEILCNKCHSFICGNCYDVDIDKCINCAGVSIMRLKYTQNPVYLIGGLMLLMFGLMVTTFSLVPLTGARIIFFPFIFENMNNVSTLLMNFMFLAMFSVSSIVPIYLLFRLQGIHTWNDGIYPINDGSVSSGDVTETMEYLITSEIPKDIRESIYIEEGENRITLLSSKDKAFKRTYNFPEYFHVDVVQSDFEDGFLLVKVSLKKEL